MARRPRSTPPLRAHERPVRSWGDRPRRLGSPQPRLGEQPARPRARLGQPAIRPEAGLAGAAAAVYVSNGAVVAATVEQAAAFLDVWAGCRPWSSHRERTAWAAGLWVLASTPRRRPLAAAPARSPNWMPKWTRAPGMQVCDPSRAHTGPSKTASTGYVRFGSRSTVQLVRCSGRPHEGTHGLRCFSAWWSSARPVGVTGLPYDGDL